MGPPEIICSLLNYQYDLFAYIMLWEMNNSLGLKGVTVTNEFTGTDLIAN